MADELTQPINLINMDKSTRECNDDGTLQYNPSASLDNIIADEQTQPINLSNMDKSEREYSNDDGTLQYNLSHLYNPSLSLDCMANELTQTRNLSNVAKSAMNCNDDLCLVSALCFHLLEREKEEIIRKNANSVLY